MKPRVPVLLILLLAMRTAGVNAPWRLGGEPRAFVLDNGMTVILQQDASAPITVAQLLVRGGDNDDPPGCGGLAYLTARLGLEITEQAALLDGLPALQRSLELRAPYLDPLGELQVEALSRLRGSSPGAPGSTDAPGPSDRERADLERLVGLTISGIAAGVQGTG